MRYVIAIVLAILLVLVQTKLWVGEDSGTEYVSSLSDQLDALKQTNEQMRATNAQLRAEIQDLKEGSEILEDQARSELGMVKPNEILILLK